MQNVSDIGFSLERAVLLVTHICNLRCKLCAERVPYYSNPYNPTLKYLEDEIEAFFTFAHSVGKFDISGGEPLCRQDLPKVLYFLSQYKDCVNDTVRVITNGTIVPSDDLINASKKFKEKFIFIIDNYGPHLSKNIENITRVLAKASINFEIRDYCIDLHCNGWVDYGDFTKKHTFEDACVLFSRCAVQKVGFYALIAKGKIDPCSQARQCRENSLFDETDEYIDLFDITTNTEKKRRQWLNICSMKSLTACMYCNGLCDNSKRFKPAEQLLL